MAAPNPYRYRVTFQRVFVEDSGWVDAYGISIDDVHGHPVQTVENVTTDRRVIQDLCQQFRTAALSPYHLTDAVLDWLNDM